MRILEEFTLLETEPPSSLYHITHHQLYSVVLFPICAITYPIFLRKNNCKLKSAEKKYMKKRINVHRFNHFHYFFRKFIPIPFRAQNSIRGCKSNDIPTFKNINYNLLKEKFILCSRWGVHIQYFCCVWNYMRFFNRNQNQKWVELKILRAPGQDQ